MSILAPLGMYLFAQNIASVVLYVLFGGMVGSVAPLILAVIPTETLPAKFQTTAIAITMGCGDFIGGAVWPVIAGRIADLKGLPFMMLFATFMMIITVILCLFVIETHPLKRKSIDKQDLDIVA
jgi:ACS family hexuronate transporter-like MFS transporter